jgi:hypothetical protein
VLAESLGLVAGSEITASVTGGPSATLTIQNLSITSANTGTEVVTGTADPGWGPFEVGIGGDGMVQNGINDDGAGNWTVDLDTIDPTLDIQPGADVYARMDDGNGNFVDYWLWQVGGPPEPSFTVDAGVGTPASASGDGVEGHGWPADTPVTVTFDDDTDPTFTLHSSGVTTNPEGNFYAYWDDGNGYFDSYDIATGHYVTVTGGGFTKTTRVTALSVTDVDPDSGLVTGVADAFGNINIGLFEGYDCTDPDPCWQNTQADASGNWTVTFTIDLHPAGSMIVWENHDDFDGATQTRYGPLEPPPPPAGEPFLHANVYGDEFIHGNNFDFDELRVIEITNDTACTGLVYTSDWEGGSTERSSATTATSSPTTTSSSRRWIPTGSLPS